MPSVQINTFTCFDGHRRVSTGPLDVIALSLKATRESGTANPVLVFDNSTGRTIDIDTRGTGNEVLARLATPPTSIKPETDAAASEYPEEVPAVESRGRGRPKLGVVSREVTLLPRHWEWLGSQPGGASVALRKLVENARRASYEKDRVRRAHERAYHFMMAIAGNLPGFEEASRALFANEPEKFCALLREWPADIRDHAVFLGFGEEPRSTDE